MISVSELINPLDGGARNAPIIKPLRLLLLMEDALVILAKLTPALIPTCARRQLGKTTDIKKMIFFIVHGLGMKILLLDSNKAKKTLRVAICYAKPDQVSSIFVSGLAFGGSGM